VLLRFLFEIDSIPNLFLTPEAIRYQHYIKTICHCIKDVAAAAKVYEKAMKTGDRYKNYLPGLTVIQPNKVNEYEINVQGKAEVYFFFAAFFPAAFLGAAFFLAGADFFLGADFFFEAADFFAWSPWSP
jgi:hypothetical protein